MQKDNLRQDLFLIGRPGKFKRNIAMTYLQLTNQECEYIAISRDTSESDLKQRREISNGTSIYIDQAAVRAAKEGRVLVIDGVEKAERNILPILNNLLENREMHLENGQFLVSADRYDNLLKDHSKEVLDEMGLLRVSNDFRVIALGLPIPKYRGSPLDPPLRSRFQARDIASLSYGEMLQEMKDFSPNAPEEGLKKLLSFGFAVSSSDSPASFPDFPIDSLIEAGRIFSNNPSLSEHSLIQLIYPTDTILTPSQKSSIETLMTSLKIKQPAQSAQEKISTIEHHEGFTRVILKQPGWLKSSQVTIDVPSSGQGSAAKSESKFVEIDSQSTLLAEIVQTYAVSDFCLIGLRGSGKTALIVELCRMLNQPLEQITLYKDMSARELIQSRNTKANGDTEWMDSSLVKAARNGWTIALDGLHRLHLSTMSILHRLVHDRELQLFDGSRLIRHDKFDELLTLGMTNEELNSKGIFRIHPAFRIVALAEPPKLDTSNWLTPEVLSVFLFHGVKSLNKADEEKIIRALYGSIQPAMATVLDLAQALRTGSEKDPILKNFVEALSTRQLLRIAHRLSQYSDEDISIHDIVQRVFLSKFLPSLPREVLESVLKEHNIVPIKSKSKDVAVVIDKEKNLLRIGKTEARIHPHELSHSLKVPETLFYDTPHYVQLLERILQDFNLGYHLCLIGNQGVGKNKLIDRLLFLMNFPREYIQLHRDTTVTSLTIAPTIIDGKVLFEDSPLVKAVKNGFTLVIDEIDKAPINVTCVLKSLVETGEMWLSDGRKIVPPNSKADVNDPKIIKTHPGFRTIVLANRPGFPFLGNDFFASMGHLFSCHAIDNPEMASEIQLLKQYGPNVDEKLIKKLVKAFGELRSMADTSQISYPYSTREVVNIVKHLNKYPKENVSELIGNVLDFDRHSPESLDQVTSVLIKHGIEIESYAKNELAELRRQKQLQVSVDRYSGKDVSSPKHGKVDEKNEPHVGGNTWAGGSGGRDTAGLGGKKGIKEER